MATPRVHKILKTIEVDLVKVNVLWGSDSSMYGIRGPANVYVETENGIETYVVTEHAFITAKDIAIEK